MIGAQLMYCPGCKVQLIIKNANRIENGKCPLCQEALLIPASQHVIDSLTIISGFLRNIEYRSGSTTIIRRFEDLQPYKNTDNFDLSNRMN